MPASDAELLNTIRSGDSTAYAQLRERHAAAARRLAGQLVGEPTASDDSTADDIVASAFTRVLDATERGGGPTDAFRPYLLAAVRRAARDSVSGGEAEITTHDQQVSDPGQPFADPAAAGLEALPTVTAFLSLPERWRAVLWHVEIEREAASEVAPLLGLPAGSVTELADRARDGLHLAYIRLQGASAGREHADPYDPTGADLGVALRSTVAPMILGDAAAAYLLGLADPGAPAGLTRMADSVRSPGAEETGPGAGETGPRAEGAAPRAAEAGAVAAGAGAAAAEAAAGEAGAGAEESGPRTVGAVPSVTAAGTRVSQLPRRLRRPTPRPRVLAAALFAVLVIAACTLALSPGAEQVTASGHRTPARALRPPASPAPVPAPTRWLVQQPPPGNRGTSSPRPATTTTAPSPRPAKTTAAPSPRPATTTTPPSPRPAKTTTAPSPRPAKTTTAAPSPRPAKTTAPGASPTPSASPTQPPPAPSPSPSPTVAPPPPARLTAQISAFGPEGRGHVTRVTFGIADAGPASTAELTASISLPPGSVLLTEGHAPGIDGWNCTDAAGGATCVHGPIAAAGEAGGFLAVAVTGRAACGMPVGVTVTSGTPASTAYSAGIIQCGSYQHAGGQGPGVGHAGAGSPGQGHSTQPQTPEPQTPEPQTTQPWPARTWTPRPWPAQSWPAQSWPAQSWPAQSWSAQSWSAQSWPSQPWPAHPWPTPPSPTPLWPARPWTPRPLPSQS